MIKELQNAIRHIKTRSDAWAVKVIEDALEQDCDKCEYANPCLYCEHEFEIKQEIKQEPKYSKEQNEYCEMCEHAEMCLWYGTIGCEWKQEPCEDAISREDAIDQCNQSINVLEATDRIKALSSVQPSRKVIEDIRAEIQYEADNKAAPRDMMGYYRCLQIIDKHISGKENG